jgi:hypothetical protein
MQRKLFSITTYFWLTISALSSQTPIDIADNTLKVGALGEEVFYYGFAEGDQLIFNFEEVDGKELKEIEITELPSSSKFMDYKTKKIENKTININTTGIYKFRLSNSTLSGRICKVKIQRVPASDATKNFNTSVYWREVQDTTYTPTQEKFLIKCDTTAQEIYSSSPQISSQNALNGNKNFQVVDFTLPENVTSWSFYIGTGNAGKTEYDKARTSFAQNVAATVSKIPGYGPMAALALTGVSYFNKVQGEDNVKYWFLNDANSVSLFSSGQTFMQYKEGDVVNEASQMKFPSQGKIYLALLNDNMVDPIIVTIKVTAIVINPLWGTRLIQKMNIESRKEAYLKH